VRGRCVNARKFKGLSKIHMSAVRPPSKRHKKNVGQKERFGRREWRVKDTPGHQMRGCERPRKKKGNRERLGQWSPSWETGRESEELRAKKIAGPRKLTSRGERVPSVGSTLKTLLQSTLPGQPNAVKIGGT